MNLINADEAGKLTFHGQKLASKLKVLSDLIREAAKNGLENLETREFDEDVVAALREAGYGVSFSNDTLGSNRTLHIRWQPINGRPGSGRSVVEAR